MRTISKLTATAAVVSALGMTAACGSSDTGKTASDSSSTKSSDSTKSPSPSTAQASDPMANLVGPGCAAYAKAVPNGKGSVAGMAKDPVAVAASNNPVLTTLVAAVSGKVNPKVNLVNTLNNDEFTVFAPVDEAFAKLPKATLKTLSKDDALLSKILTYHVVPGQIAPSDIVGTQNTVEGDSVKVSGSGDNLTVTSAGSKAKVICGGVQTANATVYLVDTVLMPPMPNM